MTFDIKKVSPWNWFKNENQQEGHSIPLHHARRGVYNPSREAFTRPFRSLQEDIDRVFDNTWRHFNFPVFSRGVSSLQGMEENLFRPNLDIVSDNSEYRIIVEVPGIEENDINLILTPEGMLIIRGEKNKEVEEKEKNYHWVERSYGSFQRIISLPDDVDQENISAEFKNGILTISIKRKPPVSSQIRQIAVNRKNNLGETSEINPQQNTGNVSS